MEEGENILWVGTEGGGAATVARGLHVTEARSGGPPSHPLGRLLWSPPMELPLAVAYSPGYVDGLLSVAVVHTSDNISAEACLFCEVLWQLLPLHERFLFAGAWRHFFDEVNYICSPKHGNISLVTSCSCMVTSLPALHAPTTQHELHRIPHANHADLHLNHPRRKIELFT